MRIREKPREPGSSLLHSHLLSRSVTRTAPFPPGCTHQSQPHAKCCDTPCPCPWPCSASLSHTASPGYLLVFLQRTFRPAADNSPDLGNISKGTMDSRGHCDLQPRAGQLSPRLLSVTTHGIPWLSQGRKNSLLAPDVTSTATSGSLRGSEQPTGHTGRF